MMTVTANCNCTTVLNAKRNENAGDRDAAWKVTFQRNLGK